MEGVRGDFDSGRPVMRREEGGGLLAKRSRVCYHLFLTMACFQGRMLS